MSDNESGRLDPSDGVVADDLGSLRRLRSFRLGVVVGAIVAVSIALLVAQNGHRTSVEWLWFDFTTAQWLLLVVTFIGGMIVAEAGRVAIRRARARGAARREVLETAGRRLRSR